MKTLKDAREERGIKQKSVAQALKVSRQTYAKYENNPCEMSVLQAEAACAFIGCDISEIFFGKLLSNTEHNGDG